jgi:hypothetical protein
MLGQAVPHIDQGSFAGHETFPFRYTWLRKAMDFVAADPEAFGHEDAMVTLGVGKNMVRSMRHWALACGIIEEDKNVTNNRGRKLNTTEFGEKLLGADGWDPYLEDQGSLWFLHACLAATPDWATTWYWVFNHLPQPEFTKSELTKWLFDFATERGWNRVAETSIRRDVDCFVRTYVPSVPGRKTPVEDTLDCPLVDLGLVREFGTRGHYIVHRGPQPALPDELVAWSLAQQLHRANVATGTISLEKIAYAPGSPGRLFCLSEDALIARLERLGEVTLHAMTFDDTAGLRQVLVNHKPNPIDILSRYYHRQRSHAGNRAARR